ncbi:MAG: hypothetical protein HY721_35210, partial [Planctomycetes bacterium]|nr:hypothetical protein [Planctomycetota bacterium]
RRERAEWCWAMLADHAWNGTDDKNRRHNASLRRRWGEELEGTARSLIEGAWSALGLEPAGEEVALFNPLSFPRSDLARLDAPEGFRGSVEVEGRPVPSQVVEEDGKRVLCFVAPDVPAFGFSWARLVPAAPPAPAGPLRAAPGSLEGPRFRLAIDPRTGGIASLVHVPSGAELVAAGAGRSLGETSWVVAGKERPLAGVRSEVAAEGPVLARLRVRAAAPGLEATTLVTLYAELDRVDLEMRLRKEPVTEEERLCHVFPVLREGSVLRVETTGAVVRPRREPEGDLLPGADPRRIAVQGFADASAPGRPGTTVIPLDAFALRLDLGGVALEALGNDQNPKEVTRDQDGVRDFAFRYSLRGHAGGYDGAAAFAGSRDAACPLLAARGRLPAARRGTGIALDPARAIATCLKPADDEPGVGCILRLWETSGRAGPLRIDLGAAGVRRAVETDLLERDRRELELSGGAATLDLRAHGFAAVRLVR